MVQKKLFKYLILDQPETFKNIINTGNIPENIAKSITFEKNSINKNMFKTEMYAEYVEFYQTFVMNIVKKEYTEYRAFDFDKFLVVMDELPKESAYYYIANNLLKNTDKDALEKIIDIFLYNYPSGELNEKIKEKFKRE